MVSRRLVKAGSLVKHVVALHDPVGALVIDYSRARRPQLPGQNGCNSAISVIAGQVGDDISARALLSS